MQQNKRLYARLGNYFASNNSYTSHNEPVKFTHLEKGVKKDHRLLVSSTRLFFPQGSLLLNDIKKLF